jgi:homoserine dehydrogenase
MVAMDSHHIPLRDKFCKARRPQPALWLKLSGIIGLSSVFIHSQEDMPVSEENLSVSQQQPSAQESRVKPRHKRPLRIALFGFGTVGSSVARILVESKPQGLELTHIFNRGVERKRVDWVPSSVQWSEDADAVLSSDVDVVVELAGGLDPAGGWVRRALSAGKSVVTANKKLIAYQGVELERLAAAKGGHLKYGAAVAGGIPVIPGLEQGLAGDRIERIEGILNGTCNFILSRMETGAEYATVLAAAQAKGYAEADPTEDVGGFDARAKLAILMRLALRVAVDPDEIVPRPITAVSAVDFSYAKDLGCTIRQIARAERSSGPVAATVGPMLVDMHSPLAWSRGTENMVILTGHYGGDVVFSGRGAGGHPTAVAVVSDLLALAHGSRRVELPSAPARVGAEFEVPHYIRFLVADRPGIVAAITAALAAEGINIRAIVQKAGYPQHALPFVVTVEPCKHSALQRALAGIRTMDCMLEEPLDLQMLE